MPNLVIADSDEEDGDCIDEQIQDLHIPEENHAAGQDPIAHRTSSTDPSFFMNVYNDQIQNVEDHTNGDDRGAPGGYSIPSSEMTAPAPFKRVVTGLANPSSLASTTEQASKREAKTKRGKVSNELTQQSISTVPATTAVPVDDLWEVPSSPEKERPPRVTKLQTQRKLLSKTIGRQEEPQNSPDELNNDEFDDLGSTKCHDAAFQSEGRKRRKLRPAAPTPSNEVDLIAIPSSHDRGLSEQNPLPVAADSSMLPPTLPVSNPSFFVATKQLTAAQRREYQSIPVSSCESFDQGPLPPMQNGQGGFEFSSGSATNVNTPRSAPALSTASLQPSSNIELRDETIQRPEAGRRSPLIEVLPEAQQAFEDEIPDAQPIISGPKDLESMDPLSIPDTSAAADLSFTEDGKPSEPTKGGDAKQERAKKPRGRPKKKKPDEDTEPPETPVTAQPTKEKTATKSGRKRGRPRKIAQKTAEETEQPAISRLDQDAQTPDRRTEAKILDYDKEVKHDEESPQNATPEPSNQNMETKQDATGKNQRVLSDVRETESNVLENPGKSEKTENKADDKSALTAKGLSALGSMKKSVVRVGLSKRSRIAPLLKSIRK